jgi:hypothetical protein
MPYLPQNLVKGDKMDLTKRDFFNDGRQKNYDKFILIIINRQKPGAVRLWPSLNKPPKPA